MKSSTWCGSSLARASARGDVVRSHDHLANGVDAVPGEEHVLGSTQADALGAEFSGFEGVGRRVGVGSNLQPSHFVCPFHQRVISIVELRLNRLDLANEDLARSAVDCDPFANGHLDSVGANDLARFVDGQIGTANHAAFADSSGYNSSVGRHAASGCNDRLRGDHAGESRQGWSRV